MEGIYVICQDNSNAVKAAITNVQPEQMEPGGVQTEVEKLPEPQEIHGLVPVLMLNRQDNTLYYDYFEPESIDKKVADLQQENADLNLTLGNLILESANDKATISSLNDTLGNLLLEVAALKGGAV